MRANGSSGMNGGKNRSEPGSTIGPGIRILVVEDNPADAELIQYELAENGIPLVPLRVETEQDFIRSLREFSPDLILSDYDLPSFDGAKALKLAKQYSPGTPFILVTGAVGEDRAIEILTGGATDYVLKSRLSKLVPAVRRAMSEADEYKKRKRAELERDRLLRDLEDRVRERTAALQAEVSIRKKIEERLRLALRGANQGIWDWDLKNNRLICDARCRELLSVQAECTYRQFLDAVHPGDRERVSASFLDAIGKRLEVNEEYRTVQPNGSIRWLLTKGKGHYEEDGEPLRMSGTIMDITDRKRSEEVLREREERFRRMFMHHHAVMLLIDPHTGAIRDANAAASEFYGFTLEKLRTMFIQDLNRLPPEEVAEERRKALEEKRNYFVFRHRVADGSSRWVEVYSTPVESQGETLLFSIIHDISKRKRAEEALYESEYKLRLFIRHAPAAIAMFDRDMRYLAYSQRWLTDYGLGDQDITGRSHYEVFPEIPPRWKKIHKDCLAGKADSREEDPFPRSDGRTDWVRWEIIPWRRLDGEIGGILMFTEVITKHKEKDEALRERTLQLDIANKELESFNYTISHDLRTPLRAIEGFSRMIIADGETFSEEQKKRLAVIRDNALKMNRMIDSFLAFSSTGRKSLRKSKIDMEALVADVLNELSTEAQGRNIEIVKNQLPGAHGDRALIRQVLSNLLSNAFKFTKSRDPAVIEISGTEMGRENQYSVSDNGIGFNTKNSDKLFGVFQRLHNREEYEGTGVGLAIVHRIIDRHGGRVWADARAGRGATFFFTLPRPAP